jgi:cytochrome c-type biogenesis protein CcmE
MTHATLGKLLLTVVVAFGGGGALIYSSVGSATHYMHVDQLVSSELGQWKDKELKIEGTAVAGSIVEGVISQEMQRTFVLDYEGKKIRVYSKGPKPDTFKDQAKVIAMGQLRPASQYQAVSDQLCQKAKPGTAACPIRADAEQAMVIEASELSAKCPSKYEGEPNNQIDTKFKP